MSSQFQILRPQRGVTGLTDNETKVSKSKPTCGVVKTELETNGKFKEIFSLIFVKDDSDFWNYQPFSSQGMKIG